MQSQRFCINRAPSLSTSAALVFARAANSMDIGRSLPKAARTRFMKGIRPFLRTSRRKTRRKDDRENGLFGAGPDPPGGLRASAPGSRVLLFPSVLSFGLLWRWVSGIGNLPCRLPPPFCALRGEEGMFPFENKQIHQLKRKDKQHET